MPAIRAEGRVMRELLRAVETGNLALLFDIPHANGPARCGEQLAVGAKGGLDRHISLARPLPENFARPRIGHEKPAAVRVDKRAARGVVSHTPTLLNLLGRPARQRSSTERALLVEILPFPI